MISFPNAKINLGLRIHNKRGDGFHDIESCFYPVHWNDILEIVESPEERLTISGLAIPGQLESNLCWNAYKCIKEKYPIPPVHIHLHKVIPMGAGVGGGSSDAAFTIKILNDLFTLNISNEDMESIAAQIGSDCPFFIRNETALATGRGTTLHPLNLDLKGKKIILINPGIHVSTAEAYNGLVIGENIQGKIEDILRKPIENWKELLINDFEPFVFNKHPEIKEIKNRLYESGAIYASMTGSGATVFGIFKDPVTLDLQKKYASWFGEL